MTKTDELEEMAKEIVFRNGGIVCPNASVGNQYCPEYAPCSCCASAVDRIASALRTIRSKTRKEDAEIVKDFICLHKYYPMCECDSHKKLIAQAILKKDEEKKA